MLRRNLNTLTDNQRSILQSCMGLWPISPFDFSKPLPDSKPQAKPNVSKVATNDWREWLADRFPSYVTAPFADRHIALWDWVWTLLRDGRPDPFVAIWPRGGGKSTTAEIAVVAVAEKEAKPIRAYALYVCATQEQADDHVSNIATLFERIGVERAIGKYGNSKGWRRNRLRTDGGFTLDALGLDTLRSRGAKVDEDRPGLIVFDDLDGENDTLTTTRKKIRSITKKLLPAGAANLAVLAVQNMVIPDGIFARLADGRADFLARRIISGPFPAVENLTYEQRYDEEGKLRFFITGGTPTWEGQNLDICQATIDTEGITAFIEESQHEVADPPGGMFSHLEYRRCRADEVPELARVTVWCDPAVTETDQSDRHGLQADGLGHDRTIYRLYSWEDRTSPLDVLCRAIVMALQYGAECVGIETDQGGDTWHSVYNEAWHTLTKPAEELPHDLDKRILAHRARLEAMQTEGKPIYQPPFRSAKAGATGIGKAARNALMLADYERGALVHVIGTHITLERALRRFPLSKPFDLVDAAFWSWHYLSGGGKGNSAVGAFG